MTSQKAALSILFCTFCLIMLGGHVHNTESSLACPDWPLCFGQVFPKMTGGVLIEHSHRLLGSLVGFLTIILVFFSFKEVKRLKMIDRAKLEGSSSFSLSLWALFFVCIQGILGGLTVIYKLPIIISTCHLALSMIFFSLIVLIHHNGSVKSAGEVTLKEKSSWNPNIKNYLFLFTLLVYFQIIIGAFMRHSGAGVACGLGMKSVHVCWDFSQGKKFIFWPISLPAQVHMFHRWMAYIVIGFSLFVFHKVFYQIKREKEFFSVKIGALRYLPLITPIIILLQVLIGYFVIAKHFNTYLTTFHLGCAALILVMSWKQFLIFTTYEKEIFGKKLNTFLSDVLELFRPKLLLLVLVTVFCGMLLSPIRPDLFSVLNVLLCVAISAGGACCFNGVIEKKTDAKMERTKNRPLPAERLSSKFVGTLGSVLVVAGPLLLFLTEGFLPAILTVLAVLLYAFAYTLLKSKSTLSLYVGAIPGALPPMIGYVAASGKIDMMSFFLFGILFIWQIPHFLAIALYHKEDYFKAGLQVLPVTRGDRLTKQQIFLYTIVMVSISFLPFKYGNYSEMYFYVSSFFGTMIFFVGLFAVVAHKTQTQKWARKYFIGSIVYLPALLTSLLFFK